MTTAPPTDRTPLTGPADLRRPNGLNGRDPVVLDQPLVTNREVELAAIERQKARTEPVPLAPEDGPAFAFAPAAEDEQRDVADYIAATIGGPLLTTISAEAVLADDTPQPRYLVDRLFPADGVTILGGDPKSMKTLLATQLAIEVGAAEGEGSFLGLPCRRGPVLFIEEEGSRHRLRERIAMMVTGLGRSEPPGIAFALHQGILLDDRESIEMVLRTADYLEPALIVWDPLVALHRADENTAAMARVLKPLVDLSERLGCANVVIHHLSKPSVDRKVGRQAGRYRGSGAIRGISDANLILEREGDYGVRLYGEFRDSDPVEMTLELDPETLLLHPVELAAKPVGRPDLVAFVRDAGEVSALDVARHFGVAKNTGRAWLEVEPGLDSRRDPKGDRYFLGGGQ